MRLASAALSLPFMLACRPPRFACFFFLFFFTPTCSSACAASLALVALVARTSSSSTSKPRSRAACRPLLLEAGLRRWEVGDVACKLGAYFTGYTAVIAWAVRLAVADLCHTTHHYE